MKATSNIRKAYPLKTVLKIIGKFHVFLLENGQLFSQRCYAFVQKFFRIVCRLFNDDVLLAPWIVLSKKNKISGSKETPRGAQGWFCESDLEYSMAYPLEAVLKIIRKFHAFLLENVHFFSHRCLVVWEKFFRIVCGLFNDDVLLGPWMV